MPVQSLHFFFSNKSECIEKMRWLLAIAMPCAKKGSELAFAEHDIRHYAAGDFHVYVNIYDGEASCLSPSATQSRFVHVSHIAGYMTSKILPYQHMYSPTRLPIQSARARTSHIAVFWKRVLVPSLTRTFDVVVLKDADLLISPHTFSRTEVEYWFTRTGASIITPSVAPMKGGPNFRAGRASVSVGWSWGAGCVAVRSPFAEQMKISRSDAFERSLWRPLLEGIDDAALSTDSYMMQLWYWPRPTRTAHAFEAPIPMFISPYAHTNALSPQRTLTNALSSCTSTNQPQFARVQRLLSTSRLLNRSSKTILTRPGIPTYTCMQPHRCILAATDFPRRGPGCVHLRHVVVVHANQRTIRKTAALDDGYHQVEYLPAAP